MNAPVLCARDDDAGGWSRRSFARSAIDADEVDDRVIGDVRPANEYFCVRIANIGKDADAAAIGWDVGRYTGFRPGTSESVAQFQRGPQQTVEGTAVQMQGTESASGSTPIIRVRRKVH